MAHLPKASSVVVAASLLVGVGASACGRSNLDNGVTEPQGAGVPPAAGPGEISTAAPQSEQPTAIATYAGPLDVSGLDDAGLAAVLQAIHVRVGQLARLAESASDSQDVRQLSHQMTVVQADLMNRDQTLLLRLRILPRNNPVSQQIDADDAKATAALQGARGEAFDVEYLASQRHALDQFVQTLDRMMSVAANPDLRADIGVNRPQLLADLQSVVRLQRSGEPALTSPQTPSGRNRR